MTLNELLDVIDYNRDSTIDNIQICRLNSDWDDYDEVLTSSDLLRTIGNAKVKCVGAVAENVIRVEIDWMGLFTQGEEGEADGKEET